MTDPTPPATPSELEPPLTADEVSRLIPAPAASRRAERYRGDDRAVSLAELADADREAAKAIYAVIGRLHRRLRDEGPAVDPSAASAADELMNLARGLGRQAPSLSSGVRRALHDVRGGALTSLVLVLHRLRLHPDAEVVRSLLILTADHLKVMRNALRELDEERRQADLAPCDHLVERLADTLARVVSDRARVTVDCRFTAGAAITTSCMELGALDRAALNVVNNATLHTDSDTVRVWLLPTSETARPPDLRIVVANKVAPAQAETLEARFGSELSRLFVEGFSTTGSGEGLGICAEFVSSAYGLASLEEARRAHLFGARMVGRELVAWLHWPSVV